ncbi:YdeI/OmpD-associated family protein [Paenibacillus sp. NPDC058071]|uniref:YdeI/OmpD-associated family protein n=1 Tax=Paenibacillus sp. NPDC058071 TaxID=3346326 RepID=UPI0036D82334
MEKTIVEKLSLRKFERVAVLRQPNDTDYMKELGEYDAELGEGAYDLIFAFVYDMASLKQLTDEIITGGKLNKSGYFYAAYPKKGNKVYPTFIHRDELLGGLGSDEDGYIGTSSIKFARMVGLDETFTVVGLKEDAAGKGKTSSKASQRVDDYAEQITDVERDLGDEPALLAFYQSLTPGYRKDWARYVYSAKQEETRAARREEMKAIMRAGFKSRELYRKAQNG